MDFILGGLSRERVKIEAERICFSLAVDKARPAITRLVLSCLYTCTHDEGCFLALRLLESRAISHRGNLAERLGVNILRFGYRTVRSTRLDNNFFIFVTFRSNLYIERCVIRRVR